MYIFISCFSFEIKASTAPVPFASVGTNVDGISICIDSISAIATWVAETILKSKNSIEVGVVIANTLSNPLTLTGETSIIPVVAVYPVTPVIVSWTVSTWEGLIWQDKMLFVSVINIKNRLSPSLSTKISVYDDRESWKFALILNFDTDSTEITLSVLPIFASSKSAIIGFSGHVNM